MINILDKCQLGVASLSMQPNDRLLWCFVRLPAVENKTFAHEKKNAIYDYIRCSAREFITLKPFTPSK